MSKIIILDGLGINLKSSVIQKLKEEGFATLESDSWVQTKHNREIFPHMHTYSSRLLCRYLEMDAASKANTTNKPLIVDRGCLNQLIWGLLTYGNVVNNYSPDYDDYARLQVDKLDYKKLEDSLDVKRVLIKTNWRDLIDHALDESFYELDDHTAARIDAFDDTEGFLNAQNEYERYYRQFNEDNFILVELMDHEGEIKDLHGMVDKIVNLVKVMSNE